MKNTVRFTEGAQENPQDSNNFNYGANESKANERKTFIQQQKVKEEKAENEDSNKHLKPVLTFKDKFGRAVQKLFMPYSSIEVYRIETNRYFCS
jgi:hypothetical protein